MSICDTKFATETCHESDRRPDCHCIKHHCVVDDRLTSQLANVEKLMPQVLLAEWKLPSTYRPHHSCSVSTQTMNNDANKSTSGTQMHDFFQKEIDTMRKEAKEDYQFDLVQFKYKTRAEVDSLRVQNEAFFLQLSILSKELDRCTEYRQTCEAERDKLDEINKELRSKLQIVQDELIAAKMTIESLESTNTQWKEVVKEKLSF